MTTMMGEFGPTESATQEIQDFCNQVKSAVAKRMNRTDGIMEPYTALQYRSQLVAGMNYIVKIQVDKQATGNCVHVLFFQPLPQNGKQGPAMLRNMETNKSEQDKIDVFD